MRQLKTKKGELHFTVNTTTKKDGIATGQNVVVGGQDTGYRWTHNALKNKYRGWDGTNANHDYNWHDAIHTTAFSPCPNDSPVPCDGHGHGTQYVRIQKNYCFACGKNNPEGMRLKFE